MAMFCLMNPQQPLKLRHQSFSGRVSGKKELY
nr:MAG TPA: hypothetical protein [Bacteriophage sp.]